MSLVARHLEAAGITTVIIGSARDIVEECGVPRLLFVDFPLGNPCGKPHDAPMQQAIAALALDVVESAIAPRTTVQAPFTWGTDAWRKNYMRVDESNAAALRIAGDARRQRQSAARSQPPR